MMLQISQLRLPVDHADDQLRAAVAEVLAVPVGAIHTMRVKQRAVDARMRKGVLFCYTLLIEVVGEDEILQRSGKPGHVEATPDEEYRNDGIRCAASQPAVASSDDRSVVIPQHQIKPRVITRFASQNLQAHS